MIQLTQNIQLSFQGVQIPIDLVLVYALYSVSYVLLPGDFCGRSYYAIMPVTDNFFKSIGVLDPSKDGAMGYERMLYT